MKDYDEIVRRDRRFAWKVWLTGWALLIVSLPPGLYVLITNGQGKPLWWTGPDVLGWLLGFLIVYFGAFGVWDSYH